MMDKLLTVMFSLLCLVFSQVALAMPMQNTGHESEHDVLVKIVNHENNQHDLVKHDINHSQAHDCCDAQTACDNCPSTCQFRVTPIPKDFVFQSVVLDIDSSTITMPAKNPHAGYYSALFKPPILS